MCEVSQLSAQLETDESSPLCWRNHLMMLQRGDDNAWWKREAHALAQARGSRGLVDHSARERSLFLISSTSCQLKDKVSAVTKSKTLLERQLKWFIFKSVFLYYFALALSLLLTLIISAYEYLLCLSPSLVLFISLFALWHFPAFSLSHSVSLTLSHSSFFLFSMLCLSHIVSIHLLHASLLLHVHLCLSFFYTVF